MTNFEKFKSMSDKELMAFFVDIVDQLDSLEGFGGDVAEAWCSSACPERAVCKKTGNCENSNYTTAQEVEAWARKEADK